MEKGRIKSREYLALIVILSVLLSCMLFIAGMELGRDYYKLVSP
ncbi:MAG TPA: hypothetical protein VD772_10290 [Anseongella sp.]|nr:hypothetical protein [Anseongella sp.]